MVCSGLDDLLVTSKNTIKDVSDGDEEAEDGNDGDVSSEDEVAEAKYRGVKDGGVGGGKAMEKRRWR